MNKILNELLEGNKRFANSKCEFSGINEKRRIEGVSGQNPKAIVIACADSRISPEFIFDQGIGDLFVIRVAGNIIDDAIVGSIEYAVDHLETPLLIVMAHQNCGAVGAAIQLEIKDAPGKIGSLIEAIKPAIERAKQSKGDLHTNASKENAKLVVEQIKREGDIITGAIAKNKLDVVATYYNIETGLIEIL